MGKAYEAAGAGVDRVAEELGLAGQPGVVRDTVDSEGLAGLLASLDAAGLRDLCYLTAYDPDRPVALGSILWDGMADDADPSLPQLAGHPRILVIVSVADDLDGDEDGPATVESCDDCHFVGTPFCLERCLVGDDRDPQAG